MNVSRDARFTRFLPEREQPVSLIPVRSRYKCLVNYPVLVLALWFVLAAVVACYLPSSRVLQRMASQLGWKIIFFLIAPLMLMAWIVFFQHLRRKKRLMRQWHERQAECLAWEITRIRSGRGGSGWTWVLNLLCEYDEKQQPVRVTPTVADSTWWSARAARRFLNSRVNRQGTCLLRVNPDDALDARLMPYDNFVFYFLGAFNLLMSAGVTWALLFA